MRIAAALAFALIATATPTAAEEDIVSGLSQDTVQITSNYTGTDIVVFGAIENLETAGVNDVAVVVRGPPTDMTVREKQWVAGIWINRDQAKLFAMPSYYYVASTRPVESIGPSFTLQSNAIGLANVVPAKFVSHHDPEPFRQALIRHKQADGLYGEVPGGVEFLNQALFRVRLPVPATVPKGQYKVDVYLFRDGNLISAQSTPLYVNQAGLEKRLYDFAHDSPLRYGVTAVLMALLLGWLSSAVFRRKE
jgi:uncharacterized protein (TIGR02186 family)